MDIMVSSKHFSEPVTKAVDLEIRKKNGFPLLSTDNVPGTALLTLDTHYLI